MNLPNLIIITSDQPRHRYFVGRLNARFPIAAVFTESFRYPEPKPRSDEEKAAWNWFIGRRRDYEQRHFAAASPGSLLQNRPERIRILPGELNSPETLTRIGRFDPDLIVIYGTGLLGPEFLARYAQWIVNLHLGLPDYYRGSSCNFWPIHDECPELLGAAVHRLDPGIDTGQVLAEKSIELDGDDDEQTLCGKTTILGTRLMISVIEDWQTGTLRPLASGKKGRLYLMKEFTPAAILKVKKIVESGELKKRIDSVTRKRNNP